VNNTGFPVTESHQPSSTSAKTSSQTWLFFRQWLKNPLGMAALSPSGSQLTGLMMAELPPQAQRVIELGAGTGVFTRALIREGIAPDKLLVVELNEELHGYLREQFPQAKVVCGNACDLQKLTASNGFSDEGPADAVISGLGLLSMSRDLQKSIIESAFSVLKADGQFIQFTYGPKSPLPRDLLSELGLSVRRGGFAWCNMPPASVFVFSRNRSEAIHAVRS
jgi:phosphatidylethanolamine/phosphatidyl-N-methylethanolamine N-methyltransferase